MQQVCSQGPAQVAIEYTYDTVETLTVSPLEPDWPQRNSSAACVVTQQYSSATFVSLSSVPQGKVHVWKYRVAQKNVYTLYSSISLE